MRLFLWLVLFLPASPVFAQSIAIKAGNLIDPDTGQALTNQVILVRDGVIEEVGPDVSIPPQAEVVDLSTSWVLPGLMDAHAHLTLGAPGELFLESEYLRSSSAQRALKGMRNARDVLMAGFTAVKDIGNDAQYAAVEVRKAIERGWFDGPSLLTAGKIIAPFGGQSHDLPPEIGRFWKFEYLDADTPEEVVKAVRQNIYYGANTIKLVADNSPYFYTEEEIRAAVTEAHRAGLKVGVHVMKDRPARNVILAGADSIEHGFELSDEVLTLMKEKGTFLVGTDFPLEHLQILGTAGGILPPPEETAAAIVDRLKRAHRIGVEMAFGTDVILELPNKTRADLMLDYLAVWEAAGVPAAKILRCTTTNAARLFGWSGRRGAIAAGQAADIIATGADPLQDIQALRTVHFVMKDGRILRR